MESQVRVIPLGREWTKTADMKVPRYRRSATSLVDGNLPQPLHLLTPIYRASRSPLTRISVRTSDVIVWLLFTLAGAFSLPTAFAQLAPTGEHYAGRPSDTGYGGTFVNETGAFAASIPFDLPKARAGLPIPLQIRYGASGVGAAGLGWDLSLSYIEQRGTFAHRRPALDPGSLPSLRSRMYISLLGQRAELIPDGNTWVARYGTLELSVSESAGSWLAYDGKGRTYTFVPAAVVGSTGLWLLKSVSVAGGNSVELTYQITTWPLDGGVGYSIDLIRIDYNTSTTAGCAKNEIALTYGNGSIAPLSMTIFGDKVLIRKNTLTLVEIDSRATCATPFQRLRRYQFQYTPDTDTLLPRLNSVSMFGREGTPEENIALPIANYTYGSATTGGALLYQQTQTISLPSDASDLQISGTSEDSSVNAPISGDRYAMWQSLTDVTGDGRPDLVFKKNNKLWVAFNRPAPDGTTTLGAGLGGIAQLSDATFSDGAFSTQTSTDRRFVYAAANRNTTNVWREAIDVNGDGRMDIIDAAEEADHWVVYLNTPGGVTGVQWQRRSFSVTNLRAALTSNGHTIDGPYVPLSRRATGVDLQIWQCWKWSGTDWEWYSDGFSNHLCEGVDQTVLAHGSERTFVEWDLIDLNGDGYPDFVFDSSPVDFQLNKPTYQPTGPGTHIVSGKGWHQFAPSYTNEVRVSFNVVGVRFDTDHDAFSQSVDLGAPAADQGVAQWRCPEYILGGSCDDSVQTEYVGLADTNGDGLIDRVVGTNAYLGGYDGTPVSFLPVYITLPGPLATENNDHNKQCAVGGNQKPTAVRTQGLRDLTGDGIPDYFDQGQVWIGTGTGFRQAIPIKVTGATFQFSHETESCDGTTSNTDGGLFDIDGDGKPEIVGLNGNTFLISQVVGAQAPGAAEAGRLVTLDNGYGANTRVSYVSAKNFTNNPLPFPETVVSSVVTTGTLNLGGTLGETLYAYGSAQLVFDSALDRFGFPGYGRIVNLQLSTPYLPSLGKIVGSGTITDTWPLAVFVPGMSAQQRWLRTQQVGRTRDILTFRDITVPNPWSLLGVDSSDPRVVGVIHSEWDAKMYVVAPNPTENVVDCLEMVAPLDFAFSFDNNIGIGIDACQTHGFAFATSQTTWYGGAAPPSDDNIQTQTRTLTTDDFGRTVVIENDNDVFRSDDDVCVENTFAVPNGAFPRVLDALASRRFYICGKNADSFTIANESLSYDNLPPGSVSNGFVTSHSVERRATDTGGLLNTLHAFDATYDSAGNLRTLRTQRDGATRTITLDYDLFGLVPTHSRVDATGVPSIDTSVTYDETSLESIGSTDASLTQVGTDFDGFGRPIRSTVTPAGGSLGVLTTWSYLGFVSPDPNGRHITSIHFSEPIPPPNLPTTTGRSETVFLDELGREKRTELGLGSDYANSVLVVGSRIYDDVGRVAFEADPYDSGQDMTTVYGTSYYFTDVGDLKCIIRGTGYQPFSMSSDAATERFPTCFQRSYSGHVGTLDMSDPASLEVGSPQFGVLKRVITTAIGRVIERTTLGAGGRLDDASFGYDHLGQVTSITRFLDPVGSTGPVQWSIQLDSLGQVLQLAEPEASVRHYSYSDWGELVGTQWVDGGVDRNVVRSYDSLGRLTATDERNNGVVDLETEDTYTYDVGVNVSPIVTPTFVLGQLASAKSPTGQVTLSYDAFGRVNAEVFTDDQSGLYIEKAERDAEGRLVSLQFNLPDESYSDEVVKYAYDSAGRLRDIKYADASGALDLYNADDLDERGRVRKALFAGGSVYHASYAEQGRQLIKASGIESPLGGRRIVFGQFDPMNRELSRNEISSTALHALSTSFAYDPLGRLSRAVETDGATTIFDWHYSYDPLGNLLKLDGGASSATMSYGANDRDRVCRIGYGTGGLGGSACNVGYNGAGEIIHQATRTGLRELNYFDSGRIRSISQGGSHAKFRYGPFSGVGELHLTAFGPLSDRHVWHYGELIERRQQVLNGTTTSFISRNIPGPGGGVIASRRGTNQDWVFQFGELRGNRFFTNQKGIFVQDVNYQPFGEAKSTGAPVSDADYTSYQWNGRETLAGFDLFPLGARIYDPVIGRFLSRDPMFVLRTAATTNPYAFAMNDPLNSADPTGLDCIGEGCDPVVPIIIPELGPLISVLDAISGNGTSSAPQVLTPSQKMALYNEMRYQAEQKQICDKDPESAFCDTSSHPDSTVMQVIGAMFFSGVGVPSYYIKTEVPRTRMQNAQTGVEYFAARDRYNAAQAGIALSRVNEETGRFFGAAMSIATVMMSFGPIGNKLGNPGGGALPPPGGGAPAGGGPGGGNAGPRISRAQFAANDTGEGQIFPIPNDSEITPADNGAGIVFRGGPGGPSLSNRATGLRIMDPRAGSGPGGYANYGYETPTQPWQSIDPRTGQTIGRADWWWHIPIE